MTNIWKLLGFTPNTTKPVFTNYGIVHVADEWKLVKTTLRGAQVIHQVIISTNPRRHLVAQQYRIEVAKQTLQ